MTILSPSVFPTFVNIPMEIPKIPKRTRRIKTDKATFNLDNVLVILEKQ